MENGNKMMSTEPKEIVSGEMEIRQFFFKRPRMKFKTMYM